MSQPLFGTGLLALTSNASGVNTPIQVAVLQDISLDISYKAVDLVGNLQFPVDKAKGEGKISGKAKTGYFHGGLINAILAGSTSAVGSNIAIFSEQWTLAGAAYTNVKGALTVADLGVFDTTANKFLTRVASGPTTGQYSFVEATGVYTFNASDNTHVMQASYTYSAPAVGTTVTLNNQMMGLNTAFSLKLFNNYQQLTGGANSAGLILPFVTIPKLSFAFKNSGFMEKNIDFEVSANAAGQIATIFTGN